MNVSRQDQVSQPPIGIAGFVCLLCFVVTCWISRLLENLYNGSWVYGLLSISFPLSVTFIILYRSSWHRELPTVTRILSMVLSAFIIFGVVLLVSGLLVAAFCVFVSGSMVSG